MSNALSDVPPTDTDQLAAEVNYLKEAVRKATGLVEDGGIRVSALDARFGRLEKELGISK